MRQSDHSFTQKKPIAGAALIVLGIAVLLLGLVLIIFAHYHERGYVFLGIGAVGLIGGVIGSIFVQNRARVTSR